MAELVQRIIKKYSTREQLIANGVWKNELYTFSNDQILSRKARGWLWKSLLLHVDEGDYNDVRHEDYELIAIPDISAEKTATDDATVGSVSQHRGTSRVPTGLKKITNGIKKLTPREVHTHPLHSAEDPNGNDGDMSLEDTLEIIDLDLSRLLLDEIFQKSEVHSQMKQIMLSYLVLSNRSGLPLTEQRFSYKQGYHEILGVIYLQLHSLVSSHANTSKATLVIYSKLMNQLAPTFYNETNLLNWEKNYFIPILQVVSPSLYTIFYNKRLNAHSNLIWLIRWTRLLFIRELSMNDSLILWDHILTFNYQLKILMTCIIIMLLTNVHDEISMIDSHDNDDLIEFMLHFKDDYAKKKIDILSICKISGTLCELWSYKNLNGMKSIVTDFMKANNKSIDPNRQRIENKLRQRVARSLNK
ncbi:hypothetical protein KAFR_0H03600 [Kazachstania africana CBS 2517]|uniref:Rab-GAP TBC domain-containing protein n=1 Tax=Kazachstania africana (strain ATCC 22294 / BCRC 22015 / CBS 2517 / CECT 1963 / NBRC 1671 / NRRL Y-8276) TaxID=1071382 RepID=H2AYJ3_KAZAF|nr:hypothetical protein KAFR_0H03600 [Kazachstania africana CBS 2517]CCF59770.1 hypothetical protein KAFR_0H03600 [Kazachstania africana CBS 2517]